ncbi:Hsp7-like protein [Rasamsonia emersonii CBS 393.64]|uniref:Hsp7-like protein n=1 Tax=Rasamsonia emersonii (strain ATCC 16479 / CBS 393.64 / IMI 116815) TaxID=1408163 RepID=A0A0F4YIU3_RASE3|nr:Hsp7-like protein [Rasamsonia emersonii CBS 393.64]KKA18192.1 Hsp7-like protein [Rasamsonia emersonii CBS 393.64]
MSDGTNGATADAAERFAIGISFGNSNSSIAFTGPDGKAEVIANEEGDPTPCHQSAHPQQSDSTVAFSIHDTTDENPSTVTVSEITTRHLRRLKQSASDFLGKTVNAAVITVPTDFSDAQRQALVAAAKDAGIEVLQLIHEPAAALLAYDARPGAVVTDKLVVVADLGGTRSDVAVVASRGGMYTILATVHDYELGGAKLDQVIIDHFAKEFMKKHQADPRQDARGLAKLKLEGEATKKALSLGTNATLSIESLVNGIDFGSTINRTRYELLAGKVFSQFTGLIEEAVKKANLDVLDIDEVILSGGTSHTPKIARLLQNIFPEKTSIVAPSTSATAINPSDLAARGAAYQASLIQEFDREDIEQSIDPIVTVTPHISNTIGVQLVSTEESAEDAVFRPLVNAETALPARRIAQYAVPKEGGDVLVRVCEGAREIKVTKPEPKPKEEKEADEEADEDEDSDFDSEEEEEEIREVIWKVTKPIAEIAVKDVKAGGKVEVMININSDLGMQITAREVGAKGGVRVAVDAPKATENGSA